MVAYGNINPRLRLLFCECCLASSFWTFAIIHGQEIEMLCGLKSIPQKCPKYVLAKKRSKPGPEQMAKSVVYLGKVA